MNKSICKSIFLLIIPGLLLSRNITATSMAKLSPDLQALVAEASPENAHLTKVRYSRAQTVSGPLRETLYPVTIRSKEIDQVKAAGIQTNSDYEGWSTARVTYAQLLQLSEMGAVSSVFQGDLYYPATDIALGESGADLVHDAYLNNVAYDGTDVIILIIDTGIDWSHLDFRDSETPTTSRILYLWDQTLTKTGSEGTPEDRDGTNFSGLNYGVEYTQAHIEDEIDGSAAGFVRETETHSHGTLVAGAAAGNGASLSNKKYKGMAPKADLVIVKSGNGSFSDNYLKDALTYAQKIAGTTGKPVVVNMSLGTQNNAHDGTSTLDEAVDAFTSSGNGRVAVVAAGNDGNELMHVTGSVANSTTGDITFTVPSFSPNSGSGNDYFIFELWWNDNGSISATMESPDGFSYTRVADAEGTNNTDDGTITIINKTDPDHSNGDRRTYIEVFDGVTNVGPEVGTWTLSLTNSSGTNMTYHAWLISSSMSATLTGADSTYTIASPGTASSAITVAGHTSRWKWTSSAGSNYGFSGPNLSDDIAYFSSIGPTRDGSQKPDISASGRGVFAATSTSYTPIAAYEIVTDKYHLTQGTSISSPLVAGAVALMLDYNASLTAAQVKSLLTSNAKSDLYTGSVPNTEWGYGKLNIFESMAKAISSSAMVDQDIYSYDAWSGGTATNRVSGIKDAVKFTPTKAGDVTGVFFHPSSTVPGSGSFSFEIWSDNSGLPSAKLGSTVSVSATDVGVYSWNYVSLVAAGVSVSASTNYHIVIDNTTGSTYSLRLEYGTGTIDNRSSYWNGAVWTAYTDRDWRIRPVVSTNEETLDSSLPVELTFFNASSSKGKIVLKWATESETENLGFRVDRRLHGDYDWETISDPSKNPEMTGQGSSTFRTDYSYWDKTAKPGQKYDYRLSDIPYSAVYKANSIILEDIELLIEKFVLYENFPNPFNPSTHIAYEIAAAGDVHITINDIQGREIKSWTATAQEAGYHEAIWNGLNIDGKPVSAGVYLLRVQAGHDIQSRKMLLLK
ncbi:MAG: S8 family serine peptidase [Candidatus Marinimicrobia bacterium]|nr:S8 family serine peptidase [Candidatus Neomarinimicrobiota bacterium]